MVKKKVIGRLYRYMPALLFSLFKVEKVIITTTY